MVTLAKKVNLNKRPLPCCAGDNHSRINKEDLIMTIISKIETGICGNWVLVKYGDDNFAYGTEEYLNDFYSFPVNNRGTKDEVIMRCDSSAISCKKNIEQYNRKGWDILVHVEAKTLDVLMEFSRILKML